MNAKTGRIVRNTAEEEAEIARQIAENPDEAEWTDGDWANAKSTEELFPEAAKAARKRQVDLDAGRTEYIPAYEEPVFAIGLVKTGPGPSPSLISTQMLPGGWAGICCASPTRRAAVRQQGEREPWPRRRWWRDSRPYREPRRCWEC